MPNLPTIRLLRTLCPCVVQVLQKTNVYLSLYVHSTALAASSSLKMSQTAVSLFLKNKRNMGQTIYDIKHEVMEHHHVLLQVFYEVPHFGTLFTLTEELSGF